MADDGAAAAGQREHGSERRRGPGATDRGPRAGAARDGSAWRGYGAATMGEHRASGRSGRRADVGSIRAGRGIVAAAAAAMVAAALLVTACTPPDSGRVATPPSPSAIVGATAVVSASASPSASSVPAASPVPSAASPTVAPATSPPPGSPSASADASPSAPAGFSPDRIALSLEPVASGFDAPVFVTGDGAGSGRLYVVEQGGRIMVIGPDGRAAADPFLDISGRISSGGERGLLGLAFHPAYASNGRFYVDYTDPDGNTVISEMRRSAASPLLADPASERVLLRIDQPYPNHNGGTVAFGPDGYLYIGMGDGGDAGDPGNRAQFRGTLLGKMLRIDVDRQASGRAYGIPATNPFAKVAGTEPEIWALGVRNPWRFSFDRATGDLWIGDVGQGTWEEIDRLTAASGGGRGANLGWRLTEGRACFDPPTGCATDGLTAPMAVYEHGADCSVTGGYVYRGTASPALAGAYLFGDYCSGRIRALDAGGPDAQEPVLLLESGHTISSFGQGDDGELYVADIGSGEIFHVVATRR
jgi:glucose/arabinose dehydrogenase